MAHNTVLSTLLWDFDGVIIDSMTVRDDAFRHALEGYPDKQIADLIDYHRANGGLSRFHKFRYFFEELRGEQVTEDSISGLASKFSDYCMARLTSPSCLIQETIRFIRSIHEIIPCHIVSGSAEKELREICVSLKIRNCFGQVRGSPTPKNQLVTDLITDMELIREETGLIGDSRNDYEAAATNGLQFFGYRNESLMGLDHYLVQFDDLCIRGGKLHVPHHT